MNSTKKPSSPAGRRSQVPSHGSRRVHVAALAFAFGAIALATLSPSGGSYSGAPASCFFICGSRGLADTISNILLFVPFGFALALSGVRGRYALLLGAVFAAGIEAAQFAIVPGRDASLADIVSNALGALVGAKLGLTRASWVSPSRSGVRSRLALAVAGVLTAFALTGFLLISWLPPGPYSAQSAPRPDTPGPYSGRVLRAWLGSLAIPADGLLGEEAQDLLRRHAPLRLLLRVGAPSPGPTRIFRLRTGAGSFLHLQVDGDDLLLGYRSRAGYYWLADPSLRLPDALAGGAPGDVLPIEVSRSGTGFCLAAGGVRECSRFTAAGGWALFQTVSRSAPWLPHALDFVWLAALLVPVGLWVRADRYSAAALGCLVAGSVLVPPFVGLSPLVVWKWGGSAAGFAAGAALSRWWRSREQSRPASAETAPGREVKASQSA